MAEEDIKRQVDKAKDAVIFSTTRINYLLQIIELSKVNNRILRRFDEFFSVVQRAFVASTLVDIRSLSESRADTHNLNTLSQTIRQSDIEQAKKDALEPILLQIKEILDEEIAKKATIIASTSYAHKSLHLPKQEVILRYVEMRDHLDKVGELLNNISGILWNASTVMHLTSSEGDSFFQEMNHIELAEDIGTWMLRLHADDPLVQRRKGFLAETRAKYKEKAKLRQA